MKSKIKSHSDKVTDFYNKEIHKIHSYHTCLVVVSLDFSLKKDENYYPQEFLKECKYIKKKIIRYITQDIEIFLATQMKNNFFSLMNA